MKFLITSAFLLFNIFVFSQSNDTDSLKQEIEKHTNIDTTRVDIIVSYAGLTINDSLDANLPLLNEAIKIAQQIKYKKGEALAYNVLSSFFNGWAHISL